MSSVRKSTASLLGGFVLLALAGCSDTGTAPLPPEVTTTGQPPDGLPLPTTDPLTGVTAQTEACQS